MNQQDVLALAKEENRQAIAALMNKALQPKGITVKVGLKDDCLQVLLESEQPSNQSEITALVEKGVKVLAIPGIHKLAIYARCSGQQMPGWTQTIQLLPTQPPVASSEIAHTQLATDAPTLEEKVEQAKAPKTLLPTSWLVSSSIALGGVLTLFSLFLSLVSIVGATGYTAWEAKRKPLNSTGRLRTWCFSFLIGTGASFVLLLLNLALTEKPAITTASVSPSPSAVSEPQASEPSPSAITSEPSVIVHFSL